MTEKFEKDLSQGIISLSLGKPVSAAPSLAASQKEWDSALTLDQFNFVYGVSIKVKPASVKLLWDDTALYALFRCANPGTAEFAHRRNDKVELFLCQSYGKSNLFFQLTVQLQCEATCFLKGEGIKTPQPVTGFTTEIVRRDGEWMAMVTVPWTLIEGKPSGPFGIFITRNRNCEGEVSSPFAVDRMWTFHPDIFIPTVLGGEPNVYKSQNTLARTPFGFFHWQATLVHTKPSVEELAYIWKVQQKLGEPTTPKTLADRCYLAQRMHDILELEGFYFISELNPIWCQYKKKYYPAQARDAVNRALVKGDEATACSIVDQMLSVYDSIIRTWFADESPCDFNNNVWTELDSIEEIQTKDHETLICGYAGSHKVTLQVSFPALGGIRLHADACGFWQPTDFSQIQTKTSQTNSTIIAGQFTTVEIIRSPQWSITVSGSNPIQSMWKISKGEIRFRFSQTGEILAVDIQWRLAPQEGLYGFGEYCNSFNQRGNILTLYMLNAWDAITSTNSGLIAYKPIPLLHSTAGYSLFYNSGYRIRADVGSNDPDRCRLTAHGPILDLYIWTANPIENLQSYNALTGKPLLPPRWAFEPWAGGGTRRWEHAQENADPALAVVSVMDSFSELDIPHSAVYAEGPSYGKSAFGDPKLHTALMPKNIRILAWGRNQVWGDINKLLPDLSDSDLPFLRNSQGEIIRYSKERLLNDEFPYLDFTNPHAIDLLRAFWKKHLDTGIAGSMLDFADAAPEEALYHNGHNGAEMHNLYAYDYYRVYNQLYREYRGDDFALYGRSAAPGCQQFVCYFSGDHQSTFSGLLLAMRGGINMSAAGLPFFGCDMGGYVGIPDPETFIRWIQWSGFSPLMRAHSQDPREPWFYGDDAVVIYKKYAWIRENLLDYLCASAEITHETGIPFVRPLIMAYPQQKNLASIDNQYLFGPDLLVAPMHESGESRDVAFPDGEWTSLWSGNIVSGGTTIKTPVPIDEIPVYLRQGAIVPVHLAPGLNFGESLSKGKFAAVIVTPPVEKSTLTYCQTSGDLIEVTTQRTIDGMVINRKGRGDTRYLLLYGLQKPVTGVHINNGILDRLEGESLKNQPPGWFVDGTRTIIRLPQGVIQEAKVYF